MFYLFVALIALSPLPFGGNTSLAWTLISFLSGALIIAYSAKLIIDREEPPVPFQRIAFPLCLFAAVCLWALIQATSFTPVAWHHVLWSAASDTLGEPVQGAISINPYETLTTVMRLICYGVIFWLAVQFGRDRKQAILILKAIGLAAALYATYGLALFAIGSPTVLWSVKSAYIDDLSATFINPNSFATYAGLSIIALLGIVAQDVKIALRTNGPSEQQSLIAGDPSELVQRVIKELQSMNGILLLGAFLLFVALLLTNSSDGIGAFVGAFCVLAILATLRDKLSMTTVVLLIAAVSGIFFWIFDIFGLQEQPIANQSAAAVRPQVFQLVLAAISDAPWFGTGYGTFSDVFPMYRDDSIQSGGIWTKAHNTYLEVIMELGVPAALALFVSIGFFIWTCFCGIFTRRRDTHFPIIGLSASVLIALHSATNFSLQIPGIAVTYWALLGVCTAQSWPRTIAS